MILKTVEKENITDIGLTNAEARTRRRDKDSEEKSSPAKLFAGQLADLMTLILLVSAVLSVFTGNGRNALFIMAAALLKTAVGFVREYRCMRRLAMLKELSAPTMRVYRDGKLTEIPNEQIVCGDVFEIEAGEIFPCNCLIILQNKLECNEKAETAVRKREYHGESETDKPGLEYIGYEGSEVLSGTARCEALSDGKSASFVKEQSSPMREELRTFESVFSAVSIAISAAVLVIGLMKGENLSNILLISCALAAAVIPDKGTAAVKIAEAKAADELVKSDILLRDPDAAEPLGCADIILTGKSGWLSEETPGVRRMCVLGEKTVCYEYSEYSGRLISESGENRMAWEDNALGESLICAAVCSNARRVRSAYSGKRERHRRDIFEGDPLDCALLKICSACGIDGDLMLMSKIDEKPFDGSYSAVTCKSADGAINVYGKGVPETVIPMCTCKRTQNGSEPLSDKARGEILDKCADWERDGLKTIVLFETVGSETYLLAAVAFGERLHENSIEAVRECRRAGVRPLMLTGSSRQTACAAAAELGILSGTKRCCTGEELDAMTDEQLSSILDAISVFARVDAAHKARILEAFQKQGHICVLTGDTYDIETMRAADVGASLESGARLAKYNSDICAGDFSHLIKAIRAGRSVFDNIRRPLRFHIIYSSALLIIMICAPLMGMPLPFTALQLLFLRLLAEFPAMGLALEPPAKRLLSRPAANSENRIFAQHDHRNSAVRGVFSAVAVLGAYSIALGNSSLEQARTAALIAAVLSIIPSALEGRHTAVTWTGVLTALLIAAACIVLVKPSDIFGFAMLSSRGFMVSAAIGILIPFIAFVVRRKSISRKA